VPDRHPHNLVLIGFMGSGKSSVGRLAAKVLDFEFLDTDQAIVERAGKSIADIFAEDGEAAFRSIETEVIASLSGLQRHVISTGGGAVIAAKNREVLRTLGFVVCLMASDEVLFERVSRNSKRPLLQTENPRATLSALLLDRNVLYAETAHWTLDTSDMPLSDAVEELTAAAKEAFAWKRSS